MAILIVESSPQSRDHLTSLLGAEGYTEVVTAESARHAFQYLGLEDPAQAAGEVDLILLDMGIPDKGGVDACALISERDRLRDVPIVMLVGDAETGELEAAFKAGAVDYVSKPPSRVELLARVRAGLRIKREVDPRPPRPKDSFELTPFLHPASHP